jgi:hypothetical protein
MKTMDMKTMDSHQSHHSVTTHSETPNHKPECYAVAQPAQDVNAAVAMMCSETPSALAQALASPAARQWRQAMDKGIASLCAHCTWDLQVEPVGRKPFAF